MYILTHSAETVVFDRQTLQIFSGCSAQPIDLKISGILHMYMVYWYLNIQTFAFKTVDFVASAISVFLRKHFNSA